MLQIEDAVNSPHFLEWNLGAAMLNSERSLWQDAGVWLMLCGLEACSLQCKKDRKTRLDTGK